MPNFLDAAFTFIPSSVMASRASEKAASVQFPVLRLVGAAGTAALVTSPPRPAIATFPGGASVSPMLTLSDRRRRQERVCTPSRWSSPCNARKPSPRR